MAIACAFRALSYPYVSYPLPSTATSAAGTCYLAELPYSGRPRWACGGTWYVFRVPGCQGASWPSPAADRRRQFQCRTSRAICQVPCVFAKHIRKLALFTRISNMAACCLIAQATPSPLGDFYLFTTYSMAHAGSPLSPNLLILLDYSVRATA